MTSRTPCSCLLSTRSGRSSTEVCRAGSSSFTTTATTQSVSSPLRTAPAGGRRAPFTAIFVGRCEPRKGLHYASGRGSTPTQLKGVASVICRIPRAGLREVLVPLLAHPSVEVHGFVPDPAALMRDSDVFVLPSVEEGSALVRSSTKPADAYRSFRGRRRACRDGIDGLVHAPGDVATLTDQLTRVPQNRDSERLVVPASPGQTTSWSAAGEEFAGIYAAQVERAKARAAVAPTSARMRRRRARRREASVAVERPEVSRVARIDRGSAADEMKVGVGIDEARRCVAVGRPAGAALHDVVAPVVGDTPFPSAVQLPLPA